MKIYLPLIFTFILLTSISGYAQVAVIANKSVSESSITSDQLGDIYTLRIKTWPDGSVVVPLAFKLDPQNRKMVEYFGKSPLEMKKFWMKLLLTGEGQPPEFIETDEEMIRKVASTPGALGFADASKVTGAVKVLVIIK